MKNLVTKTFKNNSSWTAPAGVKKVRVKTYRYPGFGLAMKDQTLILGGDGALWGTGDNGFSQAVGDNATAGSYISNPTLAGKGNVSSERPFTAVACVGSGTIGIDKGTGRVWGWGGNNSGQLGTQNTTNISNPIVIGRDMPVRGIAFGKTGQALMLRDLQGQLWVSGYNTSGSLGINASGNRSSIVQIAGGGYWRFVTGSTQFATAFGAGIRPDGTLWAWGQNSFGGLGQGNTFGNSSPVQVGVASNWKQVACGDGAMIALNEDGEIYSCGLNDYGQLGFGTTVDALELYQIGSATGWKFIDAANKTMLAINEDNELWMWGKNAYGVLGQNDIDSRSTPTQVTINPQDWIFAALGSAANEDCNIIAQSASGSLYGWGRNIKGELGLGNTTAYSTPVQLSSLPNASGSMVPCSGIVEQQLFDGILDVVPGTAYDITIYGTALATLGRNQIGSGVDEVRLEYLA